MDDYMITQLLWQRLERGIEQMAKKFGKRLYRTAMNILGRHEDAEESVSDTYLAVWNSIPPKQPDPLAGFVYRTGRNIALDRLRYLTADKRDGRYDLSLEELAAYIPAKALEETVEARELGRAINGFLSGLSAENRRMFLRRYWYGDSIREVARDQGLRTNTATVRLGRLRNQLRDYLQKEGYCDE